MMTITEEARQHLRLWKRQLREADAASKHFLQRGDRMDQRKYPGTDLVKVDREWAEDDDQPQDGDQPQDDGVVLQRCESCGESTTVAAPEGYEFREMDDAGDDDKAARWQCPECGAPNRLTEYKLRSVSEAVATFRTAWREADRVRPVQAREAVGVFTELYDSPDGPSLAGLEAITTFDAAYARP